MMGRKILNIIMLGPQGSGKGTQAQRLSEKYNLYHMETGKIFRKLAQQKSTLGKKINMQMNVRGKLIPTDFVIKILMNELKKVSQKRGVIFDGYPRTINQARALDKLLIHLRRQLTHVFYLPISRRITVKRLALRRTCQKCGRIFILGKDLKRGAKKCPVCQGMIYHRDDDKPKAIIQRLKQYQERTKPVVTYYRKKGVLIRIDGEPSIAVVGRNILKYLTKVR